MSGPASFVHLHVHSEYSLLDGANRIERMVARAKELGMTALALTDHGNLFGAIEFYKACTKAGIKPILGCELYVAATHRTDRGPHAKYHHLTVLAQDQAGYSNLSKLSSLGYLEGFYYKPRIDMETLATHSEGLIALSGCLKGMVPQAVVEGNERRARDLMGQHIDIFTLDRYFAELQIHDIPEQAVANRGILELARKNDLRLVATNDSHYLCADDVALHEVLLCISTGKTLSDESRMRFTCADFYIKSANEMAADFADLPDAIANTVAIAEQCDVQFQLGKVFHLPRFDPPDGTPPEEYLRGLVDEGLHKRFGDPLPEHIVQRRDYELGVIYKAGYTAYFLIVWDFIRYSRGQGIPVGPGRGSAAGSLVAYALGITELNPLDHGLLFERFLNPERVSPPDIDVDFCFERRGEVIDYVRRKYGDDRVAQIITFGTMKAKAAVRDVGRVLGIQLSTVDQVAKLIPEGPKVTLDGAYEERSELRELVEGDATLGELWQLARRVEGAVRHCSVHAAGVVIGDQPLTEYLPLYKASGDDVVCTQFSMTQVEEIGLLKMDFLGIKNLTIIERVIQELRRSRGLELDWEKIPLDDPATYALLAHGDTEGIFQLESSGMTNLVRQLRPTEFADIVALLALYRPGPLGAGMDQMYVARKHGKERVTYDHPLLEPILRETYGIILYQEQVMNIARAMAGFTMGQADVLRKAMGKKKEDLMEKLHANFVEGSVANGIDEALAQHVWEQMETFAGYGFNKSHSAAYAVITFRTAYLRAHYPVEFMAALMTNEINRTGPESKIAVYANVCREREIRLLPPDANRSAALFTVEHGVGIRLGLGAVKGVGVKAIDEMVAERERGGPFNSFLDFCTRVPPAILNARVMEALIKVGTFDCFGANRSQLIAALPQAIELANQRQRDLAAGQTSMFDMMDGGDGGTGGAAKAVQDIEMPKIPEWPPREKLDFEKQLLGFYLTGHPLDRFRIDVQSFGQPSSKVAQMKEGDAIVWLGMVTKVQPRLDKGGRPWAVLEGEDFDGPVEIKCWPRTYEQYSGLLEPETLIAVRGVISRWREANQVEAKEIQKIQDLRKKAAAAIEIEWDTPALTTRALDSLKTIAKKYKGRRPVEISLRQHDAGRVRFAIDKPPRIELSDECVEALGQLDGRPRIRFAAM